MKIAQVALLYESVPPRLYGGTERMAAHLADALVNLGHDAVLSRFSITIVAVEREPSLPPS